MDSWNIPTETQTLLIDLGDVIININPQLTTEAFMQYVDVKPLKDYSQLKESGWLDDFEKGKITVHEFIPLFIKETGIAITTEDFISAWNTMLIDIPKSRIAKLYELETKYRLLLISNTNPIHIAWINQYLQQHFGIEKVNDLFHKTFLSFEQGMMKPDPAFFRMVLNSEKTGPGQILFIDDSPEHIETANSMGFKTCLISLAQPLESISF